MASGSKDNAAVDALLARAHSLAASGNLHGATSLAADAARVHPRSAAAHAIWGQLLAAMPAHRLALEPLRKAVALDGAKARHHMLLGLSLQAVGKADEALQSLERAAALDPKLATAHLVIVDLHRRSNRAEKAHAAVLRAAKSLPTDATIRALVAEDELHSGNAARARQLAEQLAGELEKSGEGRLDALTRSLHTLSQALDSLGDHAGAFAASGKRNTAHLGTPQVRMMLERPILHDVMEAFVDTPAERFSAWAAAEPVDGLPTPAFLVGFPRSGTTMTENVLGAHPGLVTTSERPMMMSAFDAVLATMPPAPEGGIVAAATEPAWRRWDRLTDEQVRRFRSAYWRQADAELLEPRRAGDARLLVDKFPMHLARLGLINRFFPRARVIIALRDPRDCCVSAFMQHFNINPATARFLTIESTAEMYRRLFSFYLGVRGRLSLPMLEVKYEDTVADLEGSARRLLDFLGLPWDERVLRPEENAGAKYVGTPSWSAVTGKVNTRARGRWMRYRTELGPVLGVLEEFVNELGYDAAGR
ncbi:MAG: sulfotransferase [Phycisphaerales bacterium]